MTRKRLDVASALSNLPMFRQLEPEQTAAIVRGTRVVRGGRGDLLFSKGDMPTGFYVIMYGQVKLALSTNRGLEKVLQLLGPGQSFGEAVMLLEREYLVHAECLADTLLLHVPKQAIFDAIDADPRFARRMLAGLSFRLHEMVSDVEAYSMRSAAQRLVGYLLNLCDGQDADGQRISLPTSKHLVASRLNLTPETLSRILHTLADEALIRVEGRSVVICDVERLKAYI